MDSHTDRPTDAAVRLRKLLASMESRLRPNGPDVDFPAIYAYISGDLPDKIRQDVEQLIYTWKDWFRVYWKLRCEVESSEVRSKQGGSQESKRPDLHGSNVSPQDETEWALAQLPTNLPQDAVQFAAVLVAALCMTARCHPSFTRYRGKTQEQDAEELHPEKLLAEIQEKGSVSIRGPGRWLRVVASHDQVSLCIGKSPAQPIKEFRVDFLCGNVISHTMCSEEGDVHLTIRELEQLAGQSIDRILITVNESD